MNNKKIVIVGGGTSGWLSAAYLAKRLKQASSSLLDITLIESSDIPTIGVGEATIPGIRQTLSELGISEKLFMRSCNATFKQAIKFVDWVNEPENGHSSHYYHNFSEPLKAGPEMYAPYWALEKKAIGRDYSYSATIQSQLCDKYLAPKRLNDKDYTGPMHYAYHFDAGKFATLLKTEAKKNGVKHLVGNVSDVVKHSNGDIALLKTKEHGELIADLYIDCTGFSAHLIEKSMGSEFKNINDVLFVDSAVTALVEYEEGEEIATATSSTAKEAGWVWDIALATRRGTGYVYSSKYTTKQRAEEVLKEYIGKQGVNVKFRHLDMKVGYREKQWVNNCISIGLSAGFIEPLESTGIHLVEIALKTLINLFPWKGSNEASALQFNKLMQSQFQGTIDFIKMHYALSKRTDSDFWLDNQKKQTMPATLVEFLERCEYRVPNVFDLPVGPQCFNLFSYLSVLYGMGYVPDLEHVRSQFKHWPQARQMTHQIDEILKRACVELPNHRRYIEELNRGELPNTK